MYEVVRWIKYRDFLIQERRIRTYDTAVITRPDGSRKGTEISEAENIQRAVVKPSANQIVEEIETYGLRKTRRYE
jgi:hypothetical protein